MANFSTLPRILAVAALLGATLSAGPLLADGTQVTFDLPDTIQCRDVTPKAFAKAHPTLKVVEAKLRISARVTEGSESEIVDFLYVIASPDKRMKFQDYLPNTTLESTVGNDRIEVAETTETSAATSADARVSYKIFALGGTQNQSSKKTESNHYKQIAAKALVLASGTTDREHGVFFKLRPSKTASLEGAKEFTLLATVPKSWRGDWCTLSCAARVKIRSFLARTAVLPSVEQTQIGMYLAGDVEAMTLAEELRKVQEVHAAVLAAQLAKDRDRLLESMYAAVSPQAISGYTAALCGMFMSKKQPEQHIAESQKKGDSEPEKLEEAKNAVFNVQDRLRSLAQ